MVSLKGLNIKEQLWEISCSSNCSNINSNF